MTTIRDNQKIICGTSTGLLLIFSFGQFGDCTDRFTKHTDSVSAILQRDCDSVYTSSAGYIRKISMFPNRFTGVIGRCDAESMTLSRCGKYIATCSHDEIVRIFETDFDDEEETVAQSGTSLDLENRDKEDTDVVKKKQRTETTATVSSFFSGLD